MEDALRLHAEGAALFEGHVRAVGDDQWSNPTPCTEWSVRDLVNHLVYEHRWVPPILAGKTVAEVGDAFDGDLLGDDPVGAWEDALAEARRSIEEPGALERTAHLSFGDVPVYVYLMQLFTDLVVHSWDLARGIGADDSLPEHLVTASYEDAKPYEDLIRASGLFAEKVEPGEGAGLQAEYLGFWGRKG